MKKTITLIAIAFFTLTVNAQNYSGGSGTETNPYIISTLADLQYLSENSEDWDKHFIQTADIDATETNTWNVGDHDNDTTTAEVPMGFIPIGVQYNAFEGTYNGKGHTITGLYINRPYSNYVGLFGQIRYSEIDSIGLVNVEVEGQDYTGSLVGKVTMSDLKSSYCTGSVKGRDYVGGMIGKLYYESLVDNSYFSGTIYGNIWVGGLSGDNEYYTAIINSYSNVDITANHRIGGLSGISENHCVIKNSYSSGVITSSGNYIGGLVGGIYNYSRVNSSYSNLDVYTTGYKVGGLLGQSVTNSHISNSYSYGIVSSLGNDVGGLIGFCYEDSLYVHNCFWDTETSGLTISDGGTGHTTDEMMDLCLYLNNEWDFVVESNNGMEDIWVINSNENNGYPAFKWQGITHTGECCSFNYQINEVVESCDSFTWAVDGNTYTVSDTINVAYQTTCGADSNITLYLTVNYTQIFDTAITSCDSLIWLNTTYLSSGYYTDTLQAINGCDSIINLDLTINNSKASDTTITACKNYNWLDTNYTSSGTYIDTLQTITGCDSIITLYLTINTIDTSVSIVADTILMAQQIYDANYQWIYCDSTEIQGATSREFTPTESGNYAVIITSNNCTDTSYCYEITTIGINEIFTNKFIHLYPNPAKDNIQLSISNKQLKINNIEIIDTYWKNVKQLAMDNYQLLIDISDLEKGMYIIKINTDKHIYTKTFIKN